jgi:general secretion pathway protein G
MKRRNRKNDDGWTFIETLIVMGIVLILTAAVGFSAVKQLDKARLVTAKSQLETFSLALDSYYIDNGAYPTQEQGLAALWTKPSASPVPTSWNGPYLAKPVPKDPWGNEYHYTVPGTNGLGYSLLSYGKDGAEGGDQDNADISSAQ